MKGKLEKIFNRMGKGLCSERPKNPYVNAFEVLEKNKLKLEKYSTEMIRDFPDVGDSTVRARDAYHFVCEMELLSIFLIIVSYTDNILDGTLFIVLEYSKNKENTPEVTYSIPLDMIWETITEQEEKAARESEENLEVG